VENFRLPADDQNGARSLYNPRTKPLAPLKLESCGGNLAATDGGATTTTTERTVTRPTNPVSRGTTPRTTPATTPGTRTGPDICDAGPINGLLYYRGEMYLFKVSLHSSVIEILIAGILVLMTSDEARSI